MQAAQQAAAFGVLTLPSAVSALAMPTSRIVMLGHVNVEGMLGRAVTPTLRNPTREANAVARTRAVPPLPGILEGRD